MAAKTLAESTRRRSPKLDEPIFNFGRRSAAKWHETVMDATTPSYAVQSIYESRTRTTAVCSEYSLQSKD
jgi:hypothetical protein